MKITEVMPQKILAKQINCLLRTGIALLSVIPIAYSYADTRNDTKSKELSPSANCSLKIEAPTKISTGQMLTVKVTIENNGKHPVSFRRETNERVIEIQVKNAKGELAPLTTLGKALYRPKDDKSKVATKGVEEVVELFSTYYVDPGKKETWDFKVSDIYDLTVPGTYQLMAKKSVLISRQPATIIAEIVTVRVEPPNSNSKPSKLSPPQR